jgi:hypothetical protein
MLRIGCWALLTLATTALQAADEPKDKPTSAAEQHQSLLREFQAAQQDIIKAYRAASSDDERKKLLEKYHTLAKTFSDRFLAFAQKNAKAPEAVDALIVIVNMARGTEDGNAALDKALEILSAEHIDNDKIAAVCQSLASNPSPASAKFLRTVLEKSAKRALQAQACYSLAGVVKTQSEGAQKLKKPEADALAKEAERLYQQVIDKYGDVKYFRGTFGEVAKADLFELRHLSIGKIAPQIEGEDVDGKSFKLSDYRGKVVLLDFWGNW